MQASPHRRRVPASSRGVQPECVHLGGDPPEAPALGLGHIDGDEIDAALHQPGDEVDVAGQPVEPGDDEGGLLSPAGVERTGELRPVGVALAALDFLKLGKQGGAEREPRDGGALRRRAKAALALAVGGNTVVGHKLSVTGVYHHLTAGRRC